MKPARTAETAASHVLAKMKSIPDREYTRDPKNIAYIVYSNPLKEPPVKTQGFRV